MITTIIITLLTFIVGFYLGMLYMKNDMTKFPHDYFVVSKGKIIPTNKIN